MWTDGAWGAGGVGRSAKERAGMGVNGACGGLRSKVWGSWDRGIGGLRVRAELVYLNDCATPTPSKIIRFQTNVFLDSMCTLSRS